MRGGSLFHFHPPSSLWLGGRHDNHGGSADGHGSGGEHRSTDKGRAAVRPSTTTYVDTTSRCMMHGVRD